MASLKVDLCPEVLTDKLLDLLRDHFKISTVDPTRAEEVGADGV